MQTNTEATPAKTRKVRKDKGTKRAVPATPHRKSKSKRSIVPAKFKAAYADSRDTCGDKMAMALKDATTTTNTDGRECLDVPALAAIAKANGLSMSPYSHLNNGQKRMCVGNKLRGLAEQGTVVVIGAQRFAGANKKA